MKRFFATILLALTTMKLYAGDWDKGDIGAMDGSGYDGTTIWILIILFGLVYLFVKWMDKK
jgi:hypothetical protein